jgi:hypothetical protein
MGLGLKIFRILITSWVGNKYGQLGVDVEEYIYLELARKPVQERDK